MVNTVSYPVEQLNCWAHMINSGKRSSYDTTWPSIFQEADRKKKQQTSHSNFHNKNSSSKSASVVASPMKLVPKFANAMHWSTVQVACTVGVWGYNWSSVWRPEGYLPWRYQAHAEIVNITYGNVHTRYYTAENFKHAHVHIIHELWCLHVGCTYCWIHCKGS